ncbi:hypothetical protein BOX15_Mlig024261g1 [Macrostomum lignano]|uniref:Cadherin domain-containing protein n=1 Tax=Macrostomum lignano TaxID=282301 RepID=A0A267G4Q9_9PLAT|nr:hypothetical protein BOX15_Mlig024261g1 [Macrostomum lignano]
MLNSISLVALLWAISCAPFILAASREVNFECDEETDLNAGVGNLWRSLGSPSRLSDFRLMPESPYFKVDKESNVRIRGRIDREDPVACPDAGETRPCVIELNAFSDNDRTVVRITIKDINDNAPVFKEPQKELIVEEGDTNFQCPLDAATDADIGDNGMLIKGHYFLIGDGGQFSLKQRHQQGALYLVLAEGAQALDYETAQQHLLNLTACDGGLNPNCTSQRLIVRVRDRNDNAPIVTPDAWPAVPDTLPVGGRVGKVTATDADSGENGRLTYSITGDRKSMEAFVINETTGEVRLHRRLNARSHLQYVIQVLVSDNGAPSRQTVTSFPLSVRDANDHAPNISILPMVQRLQQKGTPEATKNSGMVLVRENANTGASLAFIQVTDEDLEDNGRTTCQLGEPGAELFRLTSSGEKDYMLYSLQSLDYEAQTRTSVRIDCRDAGSPPQSASKVVQIKVENVNEFSPEFQSSYYNATVEESNGQHDDNGVGRPVLTIEAIDRDRDDPLTFQILDDGATSHGRFFEAVVRDTSSFSNLQGVSRTTGVIRVKSSIDRDSLRLPNDRLVFVIQVKDTPDSEGTQHTASASVTVRVLDVNDNAPEILQPRLYKVRENAPVDTPVLAASNGDSRIRFTDPDAPGPNSRAEFQLLDVRAKILGLEGGDRYLRPRERPFLVTKDGQIRTTVSLDREVHSAYLISVSVANTEAQPRLSTTAELTVIVEDENDSPPVWSFPRESNLFVNISTAHRINDDVTWVQATDSDESSNITYQLIDAVGEPLTWVPSHASFFLAIDPKSGVIRLVARPTPGRHVVTVRAVDADRPQMFVDTQLIINVLRYAGDGGHLREAQVNLSIIVAMVAATCLVSLCLVSAIVCVRQRRHQRSAGAASSAGGSSCGNGGGLGVEKALSPPTLPLPASCQFGLDDQLDDCGAPEPLLFSGGGDIGGGGCSSGCGTPTRHHLHMTTFCQSDSQVLPMMQSHHPLYYPQHQHLQQQSKQPFRFPHQQQAMYQQPNIQLLLAGNEEFDGGDSADSGRGGSEDGAALQHQHQGSIQLLSNAASSAASLMSPQSQHPHQPQHAAVSLTGCSPTHATTAAVKSRMNQQPMLLPRIRSPGHCLGIPEEAEAPSASSAQPSGSADLYNREQLC